MTSIAPILTQPAATGEATALSGSTSGVFAANGANFWSLILSQLGGGEETTGLVQVGAKSTGVTNPVLKSENPLAALQVALSAQGVDAQGNVVLTSVETDPAKLEKQLALTNDIINHLKNVLPENAEKEGIFATLLSKLQTKSETLQASLSALESGLIAKDTPVEDIPLPLLIALGLNPAEITDVTKQIKALEEKLGREITVEDLIAGVGGIIAPAPEAPVALAALPVKSTGANQTIPVIDDTTAPTDDLAAQLNALDVGGEEIDTPINGKKPFAANTEESFDEIQVLPKDGLTEGKIKKEAPNFKENLVNLFNNQKSQFGQMIFPQTFDAESMLFQQTGFSLSPGLSFGTTAQAANMIASSATAGQPHPATQMVAATLTKAGKNGDDNIMTLRLDPPELGNVNVRLQFSTKDKMVKAILSAEKPETYMMLQRDAHVLERALQSAGLETGADSLTFELQDHGTFSHDNNGERGREKNFGGGNTEAQDVSEEIIQSTVTWQVDPSTGHVRYNIFA